MTRSKSGPGEKSESDSTSVDGFLASFTGEWPKKAVGLVDIVVDLIHDKAIRPILLAARFIVFGLLIGALVPFVIIVFSVALVRVMDVYLFGGRVWISDGIVGVLFTAGGFFTWTKRGSPSSSRPALDR